MSTYTPIATQTLGSAAASVTFSSLPQNYTDLVLVINGAGNNDVDWRIVFGENSIDSTTSYSQTTMYASSGNATSYRESNTTGIGSGGILTSIGTSIIQIMNYSNSNTYKTILVRTNSSLYTQSRVGSWRKTEPIKILQMYPDSGTFNSGTTFTLYGISAGNSSAKATGGNIVVTDGSYWYHAFTSSGTFTPSSALTADVLVVAGGGGGAGDVGAGGGAGGVLYASSKSLTSSTYTCLIGAGGAKGVQGGIDPGTSGGDSYFDVLKGFGGSYGAVYTTNAIAGGSGGGGGGGSATTGGSSNQTSNNGGTGYGTSGGNGGGSGSTGGGGGGGAGVAGSSGSGSNGGNGGNGLNTWSSWLSSTGLGASGYIAGGGGGGAWSGTPGTGGAGGGGAGGQRSGSPAGGNGTANTGSGGGGDGGGSGTGGTGGSGVVIVRYAV
jgi:hypothetical protein